MDATLKIMNNKSSHTDVPDKILQMVRNRGYVIPTDITRELKINSLFAGAHLSELVDAGKLRVSHTKVGSGPAYYLPETVSSLEKLERYLNEKDRHTFQILKEKKVLREKDLGPLIQVSLRNIKDFAVPLRVNKQEIFWKYFLVSDDEATSFIKKILDEENAISREAETKIAQQPKEVLKEEQKVTPEQKHVPKEKTVEKGREEGIEEKKIEPKRIDRKPGQKAKERKEQRKEEHREERKINGEKTQNVREEALAEVQTKLIEAKQITGEFYDKIVKYCELKKIKILEAEQIKKGDIELVLEVPTVIGNVKYFGKARDKKKSNDGDLSSAYVRGQIKNLPTVFLTTGSVTKKALDMIGKEYKQMIVKELK